MLASVAEASISVTSARAGNSAGVTLVHVAPLSRVICTMPVLEPTQISPACAADGAIVSITPMVFSEGLGAVRSGLISAHVSPLSVVRITNCVPRYIVFASCGERTSGVSHVYRYFAPGANTVAICPVVRSRRNTDPYQPTEKTIFGSRGSGEI